MKSLSRIFKQFNLRNATSKLILNFILSIMFYIPIVAQDPLPPDWKVKTTQKYNTLKSPEIKYDDFEQVEKAEFYRLQSIQKGITSNYAPTLSRSICGNGDFESTNSTPDPSEWAGGYGQISSASLTGGLTNGVITSSTTHHTIVPNTSEPALTDPIVGINVNHSGSKGLRLGNRMSGNGTEIISKTFTVNSTNSQIGFWYAVVLNDPLSGHTALELPKFIVQVKTYPGNVLIPGVVNLGNGTNELTANVTNPFFKTVTVNGQAIAYKNWSCAEINLSNYVGQAVTVEFITRDCNYSPPSGGGHFGYAYIDDFCGICQGPEGWVKYDINGSDCRTGKICFNYGLPTTGTTTGTCQLQLEVLQNGVVVDNILSPVLTSGNNFCFNYLCNNPKLNSSLGGFDFVVKGIFKIGATNLPDRTSGTKPDGQIIGQNNDCTCDPPIVYDPCCPPINSANIVNLFNYVPQSSGANSPYNLRFNNDLGFRTSMQAYCNYLKTLCPGLISIEQNWRIFSCGVGTLPGGATQLESLFNSFLPSGGGSINGNINFFNTVLQVGTWYKVHVGVFTNPDCGFIKKECSDKTYFYFRIQLINGQRKLNISDGTKIIDRKLN